MSVATRDKQAYFGAGPALLPLPVLQQASKDLISYLDNGIGVSEISHRSKDAGEIINDTKKNLEELLNIPGTHEVFFLQGGGTTGFSAVATNLLANYAKKTGKKGKPAYAVTGTWSKKAFEEAQRLGLDPQIVTKGNSEDGHKFNAIDPVSKWSNVDDSITPFLYYCDNETVNGVEFEKPPFDSIPSNVELVADMSSNFLSKKIDVSKFGLIFGGAQKNVGIAGIAVYIIKKSLIEQASVEELNKLNIPITPIAFEFPTVVKNNSAYNTIPIFSVHILNLVLKHVLAKGGLEAQEKENIAKANTVYDALDKYPKIFNVPVAKEDRSKMNVVFTINGEGNEARFIKDASAQGMTGLKGHRSVGGIRASLYNAIDLETAEELSEFIKEFVETI